MDRRVELQAKFEELLGTGNVYFQPPANVQIQYPCIVYNRYQADTVFAGNITYRNTTRYMVTVIDRNPDNDVLRAKILALPMCNYDRFYTADGLNHDVFNLYF